MKNNFEMSMMGELKFFLGLQVHQSPRGIFISQSQYAIELLKKHGMDECVSMSTPMTTERLDANLQGTPTNQTTYRRMIGRLMYLTASRPDIAFATFVCARYQARPTVNHLKETMQDVKMIEKVLPVQFLGDKLVSWSSKKQDCTATSTVEAEYFSLSACCAQVIRMQTQLLDYGYKYNKIPMYYDSKSGTVELYFVGTEYQLADLFTKYLPKERFEYLVHRIEMLQPLGFEEGPSTGPSMGPSRGLRGAFYRAFYGAFEEKARGSSRRRPEALTWPSMGRRLRALRRRPRVFSELNRGSKRRLHPLGEYIITLYTKYFFEGHTPKGVGLRVADSHTGNHREDDLTPLKTFGGFPSAFGM
ncbi:retrovirus-related pol polyprotein from transposon TNT 1-94 [Tanacetum coccineum]